MKLYKHQQDALDNTAEKSRVAYYHDMGLGKTFVGAEKMIQLGAKVNLVVCQKSKIDDWVDHFTENYKIEPFDLTKPKEYINFMYWLDSSPESEMGKSVMIGIINYDLIWRRPDLLDLKDFTLMLDESSLIQHETSNRTKFIMKLRPKNVILLSGTPTGGKYELLLSQLHLLGWKISEDLFWNQYIDWEWDETSDGYWQKKIKDYRNVERLKRKMRAYGCDFLKTDEVMDLPDKVDQKIVVPSTKEYKEFKKEKYVAFDGAELVGDSILTCMLYERQLCGQYNQNKFEAFKDLVESTEDRLIVFYNFTEELNTMWEWADSIRRPVSIVNGQFKQLEHYEKYNNSITFIQYQAGAMGLNLQKANKIIYFTPPLSSELFEQSKKRIHRIGQKNVCFYYYLTCKGSVEEKIYKTLEKRRDYTDKLFEEDMI